MKRLPPLLAALALLSLLGCVQPNFPGNDDSSSHTVTEPTPDPTPAAPPAPTGPETVRIGTFNIEIFGPTKLGRTNTLTVLAEIATTYDVIAIEEVRSNGTPTDSTCVQVMDGYVARINELAGAGAYAYVRGHQYAIVYRTAEFEVKTSGLYAGSQTFSYTPLAAHIKFKGSAFDFAMLVIHTSPSVAVTEIPALKTAMSEVSSLYSEPDVICLGDFNGDGSYYSEGSGSELAGFASPTYLTAIPNSADTTVATSSNTYDRIQLSASMSQDLLPAWGVIHPGELYDVTVCEGTTTTAGTESALSDHYPVWAEFSTRNDTD